MATHESPPTLDLCVGPAAARALSDLMLTLRRGSSPTGSRFIPAGIPASPRRRCPSQSMLLAAFSSRSRIRPQLVQTGVRTLRLF
jgi:hypothetical protein